MTAPSFAQSWTRLPANLRGAVWLLIASTLFAVMGALVKFLGQRLPSFEIVWVRALVLIALTFPVLLREGVGGLKTQRPGLLFLRACLAALSVNATFYAFTQLPLADVVSITFSRALFLTVLAVLVLREVVGMHRWAATLFGFVGVLVVMRPDAGGVSFAALAAVAGAACVAGLSITVRLLSATESNTSMMAYPALMIA
nr:EamA family transporter [Alphaproteobacteria bacterium]